MANPGAGSGALNHSLGQPWIVISRVAPTLKAPPTARSDSATATIASTVS